MLNWLVYFSAEYLAARWTDGLVVINSEDYSSAFKLGFRESQDVFFTNGVGVELEPFLQKVQSADIRKQLGLKETDVVITCVAELNKNKNQKYLIKSWETIAREVPNSHIWLVGDGPMRELLQTEIAEQYISRVHFLGFRSDIPNILACTDIVCLVSQREGLPKCIMEAMAAGKPVIATNIRGNRDLVSHGQTGYLVDIGDEGKLAFYLRKLAEDEKLRKLMGQHASEMIKSYSIENVLGQMSDIYAHYLEA